MDMYGTYQLIYIGISTCKGHMQSCVYISDLSTQHSTIFCELACLQHPWNTHLIYTCLKDQTLLQTSKILPTAVDGPVTSGHTLLTNLFPLYLSLVITIRCRLEVNSAVRR